MIQTRGEGGGREREDKQRELHSAQTETKSNRDLVQAQGIESYCLYQQEVTWMSKGTGCQCVGWFGKPTGR